MEAEVRVSLGLLGHPGNDSRVGMAGVEHADAADEIDVAAAVGVPDARPLATLDGDGMNAADTTRYALRAATRDLGGRGPYGLHPPSLRESQAEPLRAVEPNFAHFFVHGHQGAHP